MGMRDSSIHAVLDCEIEKVAQKLPAIVWKPKPYCGYNPLLLNQKHGSLIFFTVEMTPESIIIKP